MDKKELVYGMDHKNPIGVVFDNIDPIRQQMDYQTQKLIDLQESNFKKILRKYLKREPTIDDAKLCQKLVNSDFPNNYTIAYKGVSIASVESVFSEEKRVFSYVINTTLLF